jgi:HPt (histidine-containing phosphotransfer) domain-containing protein
MLAITIISLFLLLVVAIIIIEIKNEKAYQEKRRQKRQNTKEVPTPKSLKTEKITPKNEEKIPSKTTLIPTKEEEEVSSQKELPKCNYPKFTHVRLVDMGLSDDEAKEFVQELIPQLEEQIPLIEEVLISSDFHKMERLTHSIKGSATNLGTGGISDLLVECNTYLKEGTDSDVANVYFEHLKHYTQELKKQYT